MHVPLAQTQALKSQTVCNLHDWTQPFEKQMNTIRQVCVQLLFAKLLINKPKRMPNGEVEYTITQPLENDDGLGDEFE